MLELLGSRLGLNGGLVLVACALSACGQNAGSSAVDASAGNADSRQPDLSSDAQGPDAHVANTPDTGTTDPSSGILSSPNCMLANAGACLKTMDRSAADVCARYVATRPDPTTAIFTAAATSCSAGQTAATALDAAIARINFYRWLYGSAAVTASATLAPVATACATITARRPELLVTPVVDLHHPPTDTPCYTSAGADGAATSLISPGVNHPADGVDMMMYDYGEPNRGVLGHRLLLMDPVPTEMGVGYDRDSATGLGATCVRLPALYNFGPMKPLDGMGMYPSPGAFPWDATVYSHVDEVLSWTFVLPAVLGLDKARVSMHLETDKGLQPVELTSGPATGQPRESTMWFSPKTALPRGATVVVEISNIPVGPVGYRVVLADCGTVPVDSQATRQGGPCSPIAQDCSTRGYNCTPQVGTVDEGTCVPAGAFPAGAACFRDDSCVAGAGCVLGTAGKGVCSIVCDFGTDALRPCDTACGGKGYTTSWSFLDKDGKAFGAGVCKS